MTSLRRLSNGKWNKSPILYAARRIVFEALQRTCETVRLGDTASFVNGTSYNSSFLRETGTPIIRISNISNPLSDSLKTIEGFDSKFHIEKGDLLVSWSASFKSILWPGEPGVLNQHIFKVTEKPGFSKDYLRHAIEYVFDDLQQKVVGIGMMHLRRQDFLGHQIPAPDIEMQLSVARYLTWVEDGVGDEPFLPLPEQRRIVARVKGMLAKVEEARGLRAGADEASKLAWSVNAKDIFADFDASVPLAEVVTLRGGGTPSKSNPDFWNGDVPWVTPKDMKRRNIQTSQDKISAAAINDSPAKLIAPGAVLVVVRGMILAHTVPVAVLDVPATINQDMKAMVPSARLLPEFLSAWMWAHNDTLLSLVERSTHDTRKLETPKLLGTLVPVPELSEQKQALNALSRTYKAVTAMRDLQSQTQRELDALPASILARAFAGAL